jgi:hypothetical protein
LAEEDDGLDQIRIFVFVQAIYRLKWNHLGLRGKVTINKTADAAKFPQGFRSLA